MASTLKRGIGKLGQRTGELLGHSSTTKSDVGDDFRDLQLETDNRHAGTECTQSALLLYTNQLLKKKEASDNTKLKLYLLENLGSSMIRLGSSLPKDSNYGRAVETLGQTEEKLNELQLQFVNQVKEGWLPELQRSLDDFKQYVALQKKLETRRSEYDSKMVKFQKARKDNITVEDELRTAQVRYEDTYEDLARRMMEMQDAEQEYLRGAFSFYEAQVEYHKSCYEQLVRIRGVFEECLQAKRPPAAERHPIGASLATRKSQQALKQNEMTTSARHPLPFQSPSSNHLARSASYRTAPGHQRSDSNQFSDASQHTDRSAADHQMPNIHRSKSDFAASESPDKTRVPTVAPRRHAPPPPMPKRAGDAKPTRQLRKALYKFEVSELGELPLDAGDIVEVIDCIDDGWWNGQLVYSRFGKVGAKGLFPGNYTEECSESDIPTNNVVTSGNVRPSAVHQRSGSFQTGGYRPPASFRSPSAPRTELKVAESSACKHCGEEGIPDPRRGFRCKSCNNFMR
ncbi:hypothetical protein LPJ78_000535 [Coemansia sp. RSA 989]|nr:hypothetical protein BX667DRAFT_501799 [Coemansia mojavensis]KAJ1740360.1 hypothetical protein LPJ68_003843 [Coemansia sp. RSA 1086]KAJ1753046.1 hypothetical protein LPJ79_000686 [Coemansia sp. RSA 1821]KAJ1868038.1 hypothetical protein LPJ78_000535 [Coemansia sp. RSA 989]KAJ2674252.1 hypothetical protein IWW42_001752 [Coemansia sp. RSA 1085]